MPSRGKHMKRKGSKTKKVKRGGMLRVIAKGGSLASDMVMDNVNKKATTLEYEDSPKLKTAHPYGNTCLYKTTGGGKKSKKSKKPRKSKKARKTRKNKKGRKQRGGGSDWITSQYSLDIGQNKDVNPAIFSKSKPASMNRLLNPPNLGAAGSGHPNVAMGASMAGAPL